MANLKFISSLGIEAFKASTNSTTIEIVKNPKTGKLFFVTDAGIKGGLPAGTTEANLPEIMASPQISAVEGDKGQFYLLHKKQSNNVIMSL